MLELQVPRLCDHARAAEGAGFAGEMEDEEDAAAARRFGGAGANKLTIKLYMHYQVRCWLVQILFNAPKLEIDFFSSTFLPIFALSGVCLPGVLSLFLCTLCGALCACSQQLPLRILLGNVSRRYACFCSRASAKVLFLHLRRMILPPLLMMHNANTH